jgi:TPP-dependent pyruvate/acetoin dehydrogenase alpha subunit
VSRPEPASHLLALYRQMLRIRLFEEAVLESRAAGEIVGVVHPCVGHEAVAVGVVDVLRPTDWVGSYYRNHGHALARGCDMAALLAELFGRATGVCRGRGGSIHIADIGRRFLGGNGIVGAGVPHAAGLALAAKLEGNGDVAVAFLGDGAMGTGVVHETLTIAAAQTLPIVFVCENNGWQDHTPTERVMPVDFGRLATAYGLATEEVDGNDVLAVRECAARQVDRCRRGEGPGFVEARTYLTYYHAMWAASRTDQRGATPAEYRPPAEVARWAALDPLRRARKRLQRLGVEPGEFDRLEQEGAEEVERALRAARRAPEPLPGEALNDVYATG